MRQFGKTDNAPSPKQVAAVAPVILRGFLPVVSQGGYASPSSGVGTVTLPVTYSFDYKVAIIARPYAAGTGTGRVVSISGQTKSTSGFKGTILELNGNPSGTDFEWITIGT